MTGPRPAMATLLPTDRGGGVDTGEEAGVEAGRSTGMSKGAGELSGRQASASLPRQGVLAVDGGKSGLRVAQVAGGQLHLLGQGPGVAHSADPGSLDALREALCTALASQHRPWTAPAVCIGLTGVFAPSPHADAVAEVILEVIDTPEVTVTNDAVTSYVGALGARPGVVIAAGTGTIVLAVAADGSFARVDGWGYLVGDAGSAYAVGRAGIDAALRAVDGRGGSPVLLAELRRHFGDVDATIMRLYGPEHPARAIAAFAPRVVVAAQANDPLAAAIVRRAGEELATSASAAAARVLPADTEVAVSYTGGLFRAGALLLEALREALAPRCPHATLRPPDGSALLGAARLAGDDLGPLDALVTRRSR